MTIAEKLQTIAENMNAVSNAGYALGNSEGYLEGYDVGYVEGYDNGFEEGKISVGEVLKFTDVESTAYRITVPNNVEPFARVNKIGGMSYKTRNVIPFPYEIDSSTRLGLTGTVNSDGSITLKGTATEVGRYNVYFIHQGNVFFPKGTTFSMAQQPNATYAKMWYRVSFALGDKSNNVAQIASHSTQTKTLDRDADIIQLDINYYTESVGEVVDVTFYPMCNEGTTALPFEPYFEGLRSASVNELKSEFGNLFNYDNIGDGCKGTGEYEGKIHVKSTGFSYNLYTGMNGSSAIVPREYWNKLMYLTAGTYYAYFDIDFYEGEVGEESKYIEARSIINNGEDFWCGHGGQKLYSGGTFTMYEDGYCYLRRGKNKRCIISNLMITRTPKTDYIPYKDERLIVPEFVKSLDGYGLGVNAEYYNYIDYERKVFVQNVYRKVFDGTEDWSVGGSAGNLIQIHFTNDMPSAVDYFHYLSNALIGSTNKPNYMAEGEFCIVGNAIYIRKETVTNPNGDATNPEKISNFKTWLSANPLEIIYVVAEPIETDISAYLTDEYIEVEGGGTITAVNEYGYDAPTNISYLIDTQGG